MSRRKKFIIIGIAAGLLLVGSLAGVALAQTGGSSTDNTTPKQTLLGRVAQILGIDQSKLESAFTQAQTEARQAALDKYLKGLVDSGKITPAQADQYKKWWESRPNVPIGPGMRGIPGLPGDGGFHGRFGPKMMVPRTIAPK